MHSFALTDRRLNPMTVGFIGVKAAIVYGVVYF